MSTSEIKTVTFCTRVFRTRWISICENKQLPIIELAHIFFFQMSQMSLCFHCCCQRCGLSCSTSTAEYYVTNFDARLTRPIKDTMPFQNAV